MNEKALKKAIEFTQDELSIKKRVLLRNLNQIQRELNALTKMVKSAGVRTDYSAISDSTSGDYSIAFYVTRLQKNALTCSLLMEQLDDLKAIEGEAEAE